MLIGGATVGGTFLFVPQYLQMTEGLSPLRAGLWLVPQALAMIASFMLAPVLARRTRPGNVIAGGLIVAAVGLLLLTRVEAAGGLVLVVSGFVLASAGIGPKVVLGTTLIVGSAPPEKAGSAASLSETSNELGFALGVATLGSLGTAVYRNLMTVPAGIPAGAADTARASLAGAVSVAGQLPETLGAELLGSARQAFAAGLNTVATLGVVVFVALAVIAATLLRHVRPSEEAPAGAAPAPGADPDLKGSPART